MYKLYILDKGKTKPLWYCNLWTSECKNVHCECVCVCVCAHTYTYIPLISIIQFLSEQGGLFSMSSFFYFYKYCIRNKGVTNTKSFQKRVKRVLRVCINILCNIFFKDMVIFSLQNINLLLQLSWSDIQFRQISC